MKEIDYETDIIISTDDLDLDCRDQPVLMLKYTKHLAEMKRQVDNAKEALSITKAEVDRKIREHPEAYGIEGKVTEGAITSALLTEDDYQEASKKYIDCNYEANMADGAVKAFSDRKSMLEALIKLHGQQYFAGPKVPRDLSYESQKREKQKTINQGIKTSLSRR